MIRKTDLAAILIVCGSLGLPGDATAAKKAKKSDAASDAVETVLRREIDSQVDRRAELANLLERQPDSNLLRWQSGYVRDGKTWRPVEQAIQSSADDAQLKAYRQRREQAPQTVAGHLELANWCHQHRLRDQERAHLFAALNLNANGDNSTVLERLGYSRVGNQWLSREQMLEWREQNRRTLAALKQFGPQLERVAENLSGSRRQREGALANLKKLTNPAGIPAIEYVLCGHDETSAVEAVEVFRQIDEYEGTLALAKQSVFSKWPKVREKAREALKSRQFEEFVPALNRLLALPATSASSSLNWYLLPGRFVLVYSYAVARETDDQFQVYVLKTTDFRVNEYLEGSFIGRDPSGMHNISPELLNFTLLRQQNDVEREIAAKADENKSKLDAMNERTAELNRRIVDVLAAISGRDANSEPRAAWRWWEEYADAARSGNKLVVEGYEDEILGNPSTEMAMGMYVQHSSCFAAGTPAWTERGFVPIEQVRIGDRVLSQNVETGELAYRPVLHTSIGPPRKLVRVRINDETITCTSGHRFWIPGKGWVKARDLQSDSLLHTATANTAVRAVESAPAEQTYNLVVDDFHSYFVGRAGMLVQDLPLPHSTNMVVPGLSRRQLVAKETATP